MLILDEPTSGVDPVARDGFWELLIDLSRNEGVTIFVSTHFMNEAERCDRISLMHAGKVLASDAPAATRPRSAAPTARRGLHRLSGGGGRRSDRRAPSCRTDAALGEAAPTPASPQRLRMAFSLGRVLAYARRESLELLRDPIRLAFALVGRLFLMLVFGYGISFDVENLRFAVLDRDQTPREPAYVESFAGSRYFEERPPIDDYAELDRRLRAASSRLRSRFRPASASDLRARPAARGRRPGSTAPMPFRAETIRGYVQGVHPTYLTRSSRRADGARASALAQLEIELRFRYNQDFKSVFAMVPA